MSQFKIEKCNYLDRNLAKSSIDPFIPMLVLPMQMTLLNYSVERLMETFQAFFQDPPVDRMTLLKALKVIGCSLNDGKIIGTLEKRFSNPSNNKSLIYDFLSLWSSLHFKTTDLLKKMSSSTRKHLISIIFSHYLLHNQGGQSFLKRQLANILSIASPKQVLEHLKKQYTELNHPLKGCIRKCKRIKTQNQQLKQFLLSWSTFCVSAKPQKFLQLSIEQDRQQIEYLIENVPSMNAIFTTQLKNTITIQNIRTIKSSNTKINTVLQAAIKEWVNEKQNYWSIVKADLSSNFQQSTKEVIILGNLLIKQNIKSQLLSIRLLNQYFMADYFDFQGGDSLVQGLQKENWIEVYKSINNCTSYRLLNLIVMNKTLAPQWWKISDPRKASIKDKKLKKIIESHQDFLSDKQKLFSKQNKKLELSFSVFIISDKQTKKEYAITFDQLLNYFQGIRIQSMNFESQYAPKKIQQKILEQRKQHNIVIEAKVVRILKRSKQSLSIEKLSKQSKYSIQVVQLAMKRLLSKSLAEEDDKGLFKYMI